jgi:hypothetical protein
MHDQLVFKASLKKAVLVLFISIGFVAIGAWMTDEKPVMGWLCVGFFGLGIPASLLMMRPNTTYLKLTAEGFEIVAMSRTTAYKWSDVDHFRVASIRGAKMVGIAFSFEYTQQRAGRAVASALAGMEGAIPDSYTASVEEVCRTLNEWRSRHGRAAV